MKEPPHQCPEDEEMIEEKAKKECGKGLETRSGSVFCGRG
jgi:hypothetical protein